jgi:hypothetical protein
MPVGFEGRRPKAVEPQATFRAGDNFSQQESDNFLRDNFSGDNLP